MPQPTREEFDAAARQVAATAPPGLSREDFYALVDKALAAPRYVPSGKRDARGVPISESNPPEDRPVATWMGRLVHSIRNPTPGQQLGMDILPMVTGAIGNKLTNPVEGPDRIPVPSGAGLKAAAKAAALEAPVVSKPLKAGLKAYQDATQSPAAQNPAGAPRLVPKGTGAPPLEESLQQAVSEARQAPPAQTSGTPPPPRTATETGKPSVTPAEYDALQVGKQSRQVNPPSPKPAAGSNGKAGGSSSQAAPPLSGRNGKAPNTKNAKIAEANEGADSLQKLQDAIHGADAPTKGNGTDPDALKKALSEMRRKYGADRVAKLTAPDAPEVGVGKIVKATGAPSAMPDIAQQAVLDSIRNPGSIKDMGKFLRSINQLAAEYRRNGSVADSDTARNLASLLKKHGFDVPGQ